MISNTGLALPTLQVSHNKGKFLLKTLEQLSIDNLTLMNSCIEYA